MDAALRKSGPLADLRIVEFAGIGPAPFCAMLLADLGADVIRIDRRDGPQYGRFDVNFRSRRSVALDLKNPAATAACMKLLDRADALIEGFRPGIMEKFGLGPEVVLARNPKIIYGRATGWGQTGPLADAAGHDINYIALSGALHAIGPAGQPVIPLNLVGDYGGGALYLALGLLAGIHHARATGIGQVVDSAMTDGAISMLGIVLGNMAAGSWLDRRAANIIDGGSHFYNVYQCADGEWVAIAAIEPKFYALLREKAGLSDPEFDAQLDRGRWPALRRKAADVFRTRTRAEWCGLLEGTDVCFAPVLALSEAATHPHNAARGTFVSVDGVVQPAPVPVFSATPGAIQRPPAAPGQHNEEALADWGFTGAEIGNLKQSGAL
jgi:alpha-methylacyl-CoA racemase